MIKRITLSCDEGSWSCAPDNFGVLWKKVGGTTTVRKIVFEYEGGSKETHHTSLNGVFSCRRKK